MFIKNIIVPIIFGFVTDYIRACCPQYEDSGYYCKDDLSGYYKCVDTGDSWCLHTAEIVKCPRGTRCSCFIDHYCTGNTTLNSICQTYSTPAPFKESFSLSFRHLRQFVSLNPHIDRNYNESLSGIVFRDALNKKYFWNNGDESRLVYEEEVGKFVQYTWKESQPLFCQRRQLGYLPYITEAKDLFKYSRVSHQPETENQSPHQQKWYFQQGRESWMFNFYKRWWTLSYDVTTKTNLPIKYHEIHIGDEMADYTIHTTIDWKNSNEQIDSHNLRIPSYCA